MKYSDACASLQAARKCLIAFAVIVLYAAQHPCWFFPAAQVIDDRVVRDLSLAIASPTNNQESQVHRRIGTFE